jgi:hypothetical protein
MMSRRCAVAAAWRIRLPVSPETTLEAPEDHENDDY